MVWIVIDIKVLPYLLVLYGLRYRRYDSMISRQSTSCVISIYRDIWGELLQYLLKPLPLRPHRRRAMGKKAKLKTANPAHTIPASKRTRLHHTPQNCFKRLRTHSTMSTRSRPRAGTRALVNASSCGRTVLGRPGYIYLARTFLWH